LPGGPQLGVLAVLYGTAWLQCLRPGLRSVYVLPGTAGSAPDRSPVSGGINPLMSLDKVDPYRRSSHTRVGAALGKSARSRIRNAASCRTRPVYGPASVPGPTGGGRRIKSRRSGAYTVPQNEGPGCRWKGGGRGLDLLCTTVRNGEHKKAMSPGERPGKDLQLNHKEISRNSVEPLSSM